VPKPACLPDSESYVERADVCLLVVSNQGEIRVDVLHQAVTERTGNASLTASSGGRLKRTGRNLQRRNGLN